MSGWNFDKWTPVKEYRVWATDRDFETTIHKGKQHRAAIESRFPNADHISYQSTDRNHMEFFIKDSKEGSLTVTVSEVS